MLHDAFTLGLLGQVKVRLAMHDYLTPVDDPTSYSVLDGSGSSYELHISPRKRLRHRSAVKTAPRWTIEVGEAA